MIICSSLIDHILIYFFKLPIYFQRYSVVRIWIKSNCVNGLVQMVHGIGGGMWMWMGNRRYYRPTDKPRLGVGRFCRVGHFLIEWDTLFISSRIPWPNGMVYKA